MAKRNVAAALADDADDDLAVVPRRRNRARPETTNANAIGERVWIQLEESPNIPPTGQFFGINGRSYILRPGKPAEVPREIISILNDAEEDVPEVDPYTQQVLGYRKRLRFPYRFVTDPALIAQR